MKQLTLLLSAVILSFALPVNMGFAQTSVTMPTQAIPSPVPGSESFGRTVEVDGARAIVEENNGVYIYEFRNNRWDLTADLFLSLPDRPFAGSVALDGNTAAVQYWINSSVVLGVFELNNDAWSQVAALPLPFSAGAINSTNPLAVSGNTIVIGVGAINGKAHVYENIDDVWTFVTELNTPDVESELGPIFARYLDINDDTIVTIQSSVGLDRNINRAALVYKRVDGNWFQEIRLPIVGENSMGFSHKEVSLSDNRLIVAVRDGAVVFDLINGNWTEVGFFGPSNPAIDQDNQSTLSEIITSVSLDSTGTQAVLGSNQGRVSLFQFVNGEWIEAELGTRNIPLRFGTSVGIDGEHLMAGSLGAVFYYRLNQTSPCIDPDGDGFGWNGTNTCTPTAGNAVVDNTSSTIVVGDGCDYSSADLFDGWGWNATTSESCAPLDSTTAQQSTSQCIDSDGDGFGWDGTATCTIDAGGSATNTVPDSNCDYSDADLYGGWGWNATASQSCAPLENSVDPQPTAQCIDSDGDGFGWDGTATCIP